MLNLFEDFQVIVEKMLRLRDYPPAAGAHCGRVRKHDPRRSGGEDSLRLGLVFVMVIILHWVTLALQYSVAGAISRRNPIQMLKTMLPASSPQSVPSLRLRPSR